MLKPHAYKVISELYKHLFTEDERMPNVNGKQSFTLSMANLILRILLAKKKSNNQQQQKRIQHVGVFLVR